MTHPGTALQQGPDAGGNSISSKAVKSMCSTECDASTPHMRPLWSMLYHQ